MSKMYSDPRIRVQFTLDYNVYTRVREIAQSKKVTVNEMLISIIDDYVANDVETEKMLNKISEE